MMDWICYKKYILGALGLGWLVRDLNAVYVFGCHLDVPGIGISIEFDFESNSHLRGERSESD